MKEAMSSRALAAARRVLDTGCTLRACARALGAGKSTIHRDLKERLPRIDPDLAARVWAALETNRTQRHIRGGEATKEKFRRKREQEFP